LKIALVLLALALPYWIVDVANTSSIAIAITTNASVGETVDTYKGIYFSAIEIIASLLLIVLLIKLYFWAISDEDLLILPFEVAKYEDKSDFCGKALSDLLIAELQRIKRINSTLYEGIETENVIIPSAAPTGETATIPQLGTIGAGSTSISIGDLLTTIQRLASSNPEITCSLQEYGSVISLTACLARPPRRPQSNGLSNKSAPEIELARGHVWKVQKQITHEHIPELVKDLSFKIAYCLSNYLSEGSISAKTWLAFKHYTEALNSYGQYKRTGEIDTKYLDSAKNDCIQAINAEPNYKKNHLFTRKSRECLLQQEDAR
jgi:hypothetical protein